MAKVTLVALCEIVHAISGVRETLNPGDKFQIESEELNQYPKGCYAFTDDLQAVAAVEAYTAGDNDHVEQAEMQPEVDADVVETGAQVALQEVDQVPETGTAAEKPTKRKSKAVVVDEGDGSLI